MVTFPTDFRHAVKSAFSNYANFEGRSSRSEFWYFLLFYFSVRICAGAFDLYALGIFADAINSGPVESIVSLALLLPLLSVAARRLHDIDFRAWWMLTIIAPFIAGFKKGDEAINRFGPPPHMAFRRTV